MEKKSLKLYLGIMSLTNKFERTCNWVISKAYSYFGGEHNQSAKAHYEVVMMSVPLLEVEKEQIKEAKARYRANKDDEEYQTRFLGQDIMLINHQQQLRHELMEKKLNEIKLIKRK